MKKSFIIFCTFTVILLSSCKNFLSTNDLKKEIEQKIAYANAKSMIIDISAEPGTGVVSPNEPVEKKVGDSITLRFTESDNYCFIRWQCVNTKNADQIMDGYIDFNEQELSPSATVKVAKLGENLRIIPVCSKRPVIKSYGPTTPTFCDSSIYIEFEEPVDIRSFRWDSNINNNNFIPDAAEGSSITTDSDGYISSYIPAYGDYESGWSFGERQFKNIELTNGVGHSINDFYNPPVLENDNKKLVITAKKDEFLFWTENTINIHLGKDIFNEGFFGTENAAILKNDFSFSFLAKAEMDNKEPDFIEQLIACNPETGNNLYYYNGINSLKKGFYEEFEDYLSEGLFTDSNVVNSVLFSTKAKDLESGIAYIQVEETLLYDPYGKEVGSKTTKQISDGYKVDSNGLYIWDNYEYNFATQEDGVVVLKFSIYDNTGNKSTQDLQFVVIKDSEVDLSRVRMYNLKNNNQNLLMNSSSNCFGADLIDESLSLEENINRINENNKNIQIALIEAVYTDIFNNITKYQDHHNYESVILYSGTDEYNLTGSNAVFDASNPNEITSKGGTLTTVESSIKYSAKINTIYKDSDTLLKLVIKNKYGNENSVLQAIPRAAKLPYNSHYEKLNEGAFDNYGFSFSYEEYSPEYDYANFALHSRLSLYSYDAGINSKKLHQCTSGVPASSLQMSHLYDYWKDNPYSPKLQLINHINNYENITFYYYPLSFYLYDIKNNAADAYDYCYLAGAIDINNVYECKVTPDTLSNPDFTECSIDYDEDDYNKCFVFDISIPYETDELIYSYVVTPCSKDKKKNGNSYSYSTSNTLKYKNYLDSASSPVIKIEFCVRNKSTNQVAVKEPEYYDLSYAETGKDYTPPEIRVGDPLLLSPTGQAIGTTETTYRNSELESLQYYYLPFESKWKYYLEDEQYIPVIDPDTDQNKLIFGPLDADIPELNSAPEYKPIYYPLTGLKDGIYTLCAIGTDEAGNTSNEGLFVVNLSTLHANGFSASYDFDNNEINVSRIYDGSVAMDNEDKIFGLSKNYNTIWYLDESSTLWEPACDYESEDGSLDTSDFYMNKTEVYDNPEYHYNLKKSDTSIPVDARWLKVQVLKQGAYESYYHQSFIHRVQPLYLYIGAGKMLTGDDCKFKIFSEITDTAYLVQADQPCMIETIQSPTDLSDTSEDWTLNGTYSAWDLCGEVVSSQPFEAGNNWYYLNPNSIKSGFYYVTRVIYADGSEEIGKVRYKW